MHSVLNTFFQVPVSGGEKKRRLQECIAGLYPISLILLLLLTHPLNSIARRSAKKDPTQYLLTVEQTIENDCPIPSYLADVLSKPDGWMETPEIDPDADTKLGNQSVYLAVYAIFLQDGACFKLRIQYCVLTKTKCRI